MKIDADEKELLESVELGDWKAAGGGKRERTRFSRYAKATFRKDRRLNIRLSSKELEAIQRALAEGLPYQTLIASLLHKYASARRSSSCRHPCLQVLEPVEDDLDLIILAADVLHASRCDPPHEPAIWGDVVGRSQDRSCHEEQFRHRHGIPERKRWLCRDAHCFEAGDLRIRVVEQLSSIR